MYPELSGKNALITGAARGFGRAIAIRLAKEGVTVVVNYRRGKSDARSVVEEITAFGGKALALRGDVGDDESLDRLFDEIRSELAPKGIFVNGILSGVADTKSLHSIPNAEKLLRHVKERTPLGRLVQPEDVADVAAFLCPDQARMIRGQFIVIDGGMSARA